MMDALLLVLGLVLLIKGADFLVNGASKLASQFGIFVIDDRPDGGFARNLDARAAGQPDVRSAKQTRSGDRKRDRQQCNDQRHY